VPGPTGRPSKWRQGLAGAGQGQRLPGGHRPGGRCGNRGVGMGRALGRRAACLASGYRPSGTALSRRAGDRQQAQGQGRTAGARVGAGPAALALVGAPTCGHTPGGMPSPAVTGVTPGCITRAVRQPQRHHAQRIQPSKSPTPPHSRTSPRHLRPDLLHRLDDPPRPVVPASQ
jgi:hypothetical protein